MKNTENNNISLENNSKYNKLYIISMDFLRELEIKNNNLYKKFTNDIFIKFLSKYYGGNTTKEKIGELKKNEDLKGKVFGGFVGILGYHLLIRQGKLEINDFLSKYINKLGNDEKFYMKEVEDIFTSFSSYNNSLIEGEKELDKNRGVISKKVNDILSKKIDYKSYPIDVSPLLNINYYGNGVEDIAKYGLLENENSFLVSLDLVKNEYIKLNQFNLFLFLHRRKSYVKISDGYEKKIRSIDTFKNINYKKKFIFLGSEITEEPIEKNTLDIGKYTSELELLFLNNNGIIDFELLNNFLDDFNIKSILDGLSLKLNEKNYNNNIEQKSHIVEKLRNILKPKYSKLLNIFDLKGFNIENYKDENNFIVYNKNADNILEDKNKYCILIKFESGVLTCNSYLNENSIGELYIDSENNISSVGEPKEIKSLKKIISFYGKNNEFFNKLDKDEQGIFVSKAIFGLKKLVKDVKNKENIKSEILGSFHTIYKIKFENYSKNLKNHYIKPEKISKISDEQIAIYLLGGKTYENEVDVHNQIENGGSKFQDMLRKVKNGEIKEADLLKLIDKIPSYNLIGYFIFLDENLYLNKYFSLIDKILEKINKIIEREAIINTNIQDNSYTFKKERHIDSKLSEKFYAFIYKYALSENKKDETISNLIKEKITEIHYFMALHKMRVSKRNDNLNKNTSEI